MYFCRECFFFAVLEFDYPVPVVPKGLIIGSKFDTDIHSNTCRIAFKGNILFVFGDENYRGDLARLKVYKTKVRVSKFASTTLSFQLPKNHNNKRKVSSNG